MAVNQYKRDGNSPNDYKKGNRTDSKRNTDTIQEYNRQFKEEIDGYKEFARKRRENRMARQEDCHKFYNSLISYIKECSSSEQPLTRADIILRLGISRDTYNKMRSGELDWRLDEYIAVNNIVETDIYLNSDGLPVVDVNNGVVLLIPFSQLIEKGELLLEAEAERRLYKNSKVGDIFALKSLHGWKEDATPHTVNQTLVLASPEQAREAINLLK